MRTKRTLVQGVGTNDADYSVSTLKPDGTKTICPYYDRWHSMLRRCYGEKELKRNPRYEGCTVCDEWLYFSNFRSWMKQQDWQGKDLDKDLLVVGNMVYSPETCIFVSKTVNTFLAGQSESQSRGLYLVGVSWHKHTSKFVAQCNNPLTKVREHVGLYTDEMEAHLAWKARKHQHALELAKLETDPRIIEALSTRYL